MNAQRRRLLGLLGVGTIGAAALPPSVWATRIRVLGDAEDGPPSLPGQHQPGGGQRNAEVHRFLDGVRVGASQSHGSLTMFWLSAPDAATVPAPVVTLDEARARGALSIAERAQATVPELTVDNRGKVHVLLLAGEILVGGKQNRVLKEDILLPPLSGPRNLGVYCVEQGRWNVGRTEFETRSTLAAPALRSRLMRNPDQGQVWAEVGRSARAAAAPSPTGSYQAIYDKPEMKAHFKEVERTVSAVPAASAHGAAVFVGPRLAGIDVFPPGDLFAREWPKLLRAYAVEAYQQAEAPPAETTLRERAAELLAAGARADGAARGNAGVGQLFEFGVGSSRGAALSFERRVLHVAML